MKVDEPIKRSLPEPTTQNTSFVTQTEGSNKRRKNDEDTLATSSSNSQGQSPILSATPSSLVSGLNAPQGSVQHQKQKQIKEFTDKLNLAKDNITSGFDRMESLKKDIENLKNEKNNLEAKLEHHRKTISENNASYDDFVQKTISNSYHGVILTSALKKAHEELAAKNETAIEASKPDEDSLGQVETKLTKQMKALSKEIENANTQLNVYFAFYNNLLNLRSSHLEQYETPESIQDRIGLMGEYILDNIGIQKHMFFSVPP